MANVWTLLLMLPLLITNVVSVTADHGDYEDTGQGSICRNEKLMQTYFQSITQQCFGTDYGTLSSFCDDKGALDCDAIKSVVSITPSCEFCDKQSSKEKTSCYVKQWKASECSINDYVIPLVRKKTKCVKMRGHCVVDSVIPTIPTDTDIPTYDGQPTTNGPYFSDKHGSDKNNKDRDTDTDRSQSCDHRGVSIGAAIGIFILGLVVGVAITSCLCICLPALHRNSSKLVKKSTSQEHLEPSPISKRPMVEPSAPPVTLQSGNQDYHELGSRSNERDSQMYTALDEPSAHYYVEPNPPYQSSQIKNQPISGPVTVTSPEYQQPISETIGGGNGQSQSTSHYQSLSSNRNEDADYDETQQPMGEGLKNASKASEPNNGLSKDWSKFVEQNNGVDTEHQYFVLESEQNQQGLNNNETNIDTPNNNYFVLEKQ